MGLWAAHLLPGGLVLHSSSGFASEQLVHFSNPRAHTLKLWRPKTSSVGYYNSLSGKELDGQIAFQKVAEGLWAFVDLGIGEPNIKTNSRLLEFCLKLEHRGLIFVPLPVGRFKSMSSITNCL